MQPVSKAEIITSMINGTKGEAKAINLPGDFGTLNWPELEFLGWRDPKAPLRGYLIRHAQGGLQGIALRAADSTMSRSVTAMCLICRATASADTISLFTARRVGPAGRKGDTVGTYICADLRCGEQIRNPSDPTRFRIEAALPLEVRISNLHERLDGFLADVLRR